MIIIHLRCGNDPGNEFIVITERLICIIICFPQILQISQGTLRKDKLRNDLESVEFQTDYSTAGFV